MSFPVTWTEVENRLELSGGTLTGSLNTKNVSITGNLSVSGSITGNASSATKLATSRTISLTGDATASGSFNGTANLALATTLANSGVKAGSYGPTAAATLAFGGSVNIPQITVDAKGRATSIVNQATKLPAAPTTITGNAGTATKLATARTISLTGDVAGSVSFDGTDDVSIATTINKKISLVGTKLESLPNTRAEILPKNTDFTVPSYKVGSNTLMIFIDGIHCIAGSDADLYTYKEMGTVGTMSTTIQFHDDIAIDHSIFAIVFDLNI